MISETPVNWCAIWPRCLAFPNSAYRKLFRASVSKDNGTLGIVLRTVMRRREHCAHAVPKNIKARHATAWFFHLAVCFNAFTIIALFAAVNARRLPDLSCREYRDRLSYVRKT